jgi:hypothetical protein
MTFLMDSYTIAILALNLAVSSVTLLFVMVPRITKARNPGTQTPNPAIREAVIRERLSANNSDV